MENKNNYFAFPSFFSLLPSLAISSFLRWYFLHHVTVVLLFLLVSFIICLSFLPLIVSVHLLFLLSSCTPSLPCLLFFSFPLPSSQYVYSFQSQLLIISPLQPLVIPLVFVSSFVCCYILPTFRMRIPFLQCKNQLRVVEYQPADLKVLGSNPGWGHQKFSKLTVISKNSAAC